MQKSFSIIVAADDRFGIGKNGTLPWHLPADLKHFKDLTLGPSGEGVRNAVIMGRKTWDSLPEKFRPLPGRENIVLTRQDDFAPSGGGSFPGLEEALVSLDARKDIREVFVIGGAQVYAQAMAHPRCARVYLTHVRGDFDCDCFFPLDLSLFAPVSSSTVFCEGPLSFSFRLFERLS